MPVVVGQKIQRIKVNYNYGEYTFKSLFLVDIEGLSKKYQHFLAEGTKFNIYLSRIFNESYEEVDAPRQFAQVECCYIEEERRTKGKFYINMDKIAKRLSIANDYYLEILISSLANPHYGEKIIFPNETKVDTLEEIKGKISENIETLRKVGFVSQSLSFLTALGLKDIANELNNGNVSFDKGDYDGAIKSYRKVIEGFRNYLKQKQDVEGKSVYEHLIDDSQNRTEAVVEYLNKTYNLLSNFGEHIGTHAFDEEGILTNRIVEDITQYLTKKLQRK